jgi:hypothetical protein
MEDKESSSKKPHKKKEYESDKRHSSSKIDEYTSINKKNIEALNKYNPRMNFLDLCIESFKKIIFDYGYYITGGTPFTRAMVAAAFTFFEDQRLNERTALGDLIESALLPNELINSLNKLKDKNIIEAIREESKVKNDLGDFMLRSILKFPAVENRWGQDIDSISSIEWEAIAQITSSDIKVYSWKEQLTKVVYEVPDVHQKNDTMRFLVDYNSICILYTTEQTERAGHYIESNEQFSGQYDDKVADIKESRVDYKLEKMRDYIEVLENGINELGAEKVLKVIRNQLGSQSLGEWDKLKMETLSELNNFIINNIEETKSNICDNCNSVFPLYKLHEMSCKHFLDVDCIKK